MTLKLPNRITFQWHITDQCNFRCKHCYQHEYNSDGLPIVDLETILQKLLNFRKACIKQHNQVKTHINLTGGEPLIRADLFQLIEMINSSGHFTFGLLSNGLIPSVEKIKTLKSLNPKFVQISLEGKRTTNDNIRGEGSYDKIIDSLKVYRRFEIPVMISFTANSENFTDYSHVVHIARKYKAVKVWTDRYIPFGINDPLLLNTSQFKELGKSLRREKLNSKYHIFSKTIVASNRGLQFLFCGDKPYRCNAGDSLLAILPNGDLLPCRRLPIKVGNLLNDDLIDIYNSSDVLNSLRNPSHLDSKCIDCYYEKSCQGGLKCLSFALSKDFTKKDANCWI